MSDDGRAGARVFVIDAMPLLYRGHFVFLKNPMITSDGINVSALHGFAATLVHILEKHKPTHVAVVFDSAKPTFRHERYPEYFSTWDRTTENKRLAIERADHKDSSGRLVLEPLAQLPLLAIANS